MKLAAFLLTFGVLLSLPPSGLAENAVSNAASSGLSAEQLEKLTPEQRIDALVEARLKEAGLKPNAPIDDATFVRRAYLDIIGRIPTIEEAETFHASTYPNKREQLIEQLLYSEGYVSHYYNFWADILRLNAQLGGGAGEAEAAYQLWLKKGLRDNKPYDQFVHELVSAQGHVWDDGATGYYQRDRGMPLDNMSNTVRIFLGTRLECAQCHNHPFDVWTQMDYYKMAAFSYGMDARGYANDNRSAMRDHINELRQEKYEQAVGIEGFPRMYREQDIQRNIKRYKGNGAWERMLERWGVTEKEFIAKAKAGQKAIAGIEETYQRMRNAETELYRPIRYVTTSEQERALKLPHDYQYDDAKPFDAVSARTMFGEDIDLENIDGSTIEAYADWMTSRDNPTFTRVIANRLWKKVFGVGVFEPVDEITDMTKPGNPALMTYLEELMKELDYDMKAYLKILYNTQTYQRAADANELVMGEPYHFPGPVLRRMSAEQIWDSIVALALPEADSYRPRLKSQLSQIDRARLVYESMAELSPEEYIAMVQEVGDAIATLLPQQDEVRQALYKAREEENMELFQEKRQELRDLQNELRNTVSEIGHKKLHQEVGGEELLASLGMNEMSMSQMMAGGPEPNAVVTRLPKPEFPKPPKDLNKNQLNSWKRQQQADFQVYRRLVSDMARASELESPARRGHFLREFGQSDREVIENAADNASVPQALNLLNGPMVEALTNKFAVFGSRLHDAGSPDEKTKMIFQAMLTREPTEREMQLAEAEIEQYGDEAYESIVWALLNTQQFLFVQ